MADLSDEQLQELALGTPFESKDDDPLKDMPDPEPHVVERAQKLVDEMQQGAQFSQVFDSEKKREKKEKSDSVSKKDRVAFMAHILGDAPFKKTYEFFDGEFKVTYRTLSQYEEGRLLEIVMKEEVPQSHHERIFFQLLLAASIDSYTIKGKTHRVSIFSQVTQDSDPLARYREWMTETSRERYQLFKRAHKDFRKLLSKMIAEAGTPDFWRSLS